MRKWIDYIAIGIVAAPFVGLALLIVVGLPYLAWKGMGWWSLLPDIWLAAMIYVAKDMPPPHSARKCPR